MVTKKQLDTIERFADKLWAKVGLDIEFTRHFLDRVNDARNKKQITGGEIQRLFKQSYKKHGKKISALGKGAEAVIKDMETDINMPFVLQLDKNGELDLVAKTVMRKKDFKTSNKKFTVENAGEQGTDKLSYKYRKDTPGQSPNGKTMKEKKSDKELDIKSLEKMIKNPSPRMVKMYGKSKYVNMLKKKLAKLKEALDKDDVPFVKDLIKNLRKGSKTHGKQADDLEKALDEAKFDVAFDGFEGEWANLKDELKKMRIKISNHYDDDGRHEFTVNTNKAKLKQLMKKFGDLEMNESLKEIKEPFAVVHNGEVLGTYSKEPNSFRIKSLARDNKVDFKKLKVVKTKKKQNVGSPLKEYEDKETESELQEAAPFKSLEKKWLATKGDKTKQGRLIKKHGLKPLISKVRPGSVKLGVLNDLKAKGNKNATFAGLDADGELIFVTNNPTKIYYAKKGSKRPEGMELEDVDLDALRLQKIVEVAIGKEDNDFISEAGVDLTWTPSKIQKEYKKYLNS